MKKTIKAWAMFNSDVEILYSTIRPTRKDTIRTVTETITPNWPLWRDRLDYRIRRITITVED